MCECCSADTHYIGEVFPKWMLVRARKNGNEMKEGDWGLVNFNSPSFIWDGKLEPTEEPSKFCVDDKEDVPPELDEAWDNYMGVVEDFSKCLHGHVQDGYLLYKSCLEGGYDNNKCPRFDVWLFDRLGQVVNKWKKDGAIIWMENAIRHRK
jgi:hypothetical protein